jgi:hypothetical protein
MITSLVYKKNYIIMLKISTLFIAILFATQTNAQIKKGKVLLGGQVAATSNESNGVSQSPLNPYTQNNTQKTSLFGLSLGYAVKENKVIGFSFSSLANKETRFFSPNNTSTSKTNQNEIGVFYRQYKKIAKDFYIFGQGDIATVFGNGTGTTSPSSFTQTAKLSGSKLYVSTGVGYAVLKKLHIELSLPNILGIQSYKSKLTSTDPNARTDENKQFSFNSSLTNGNVIGNLNIGFRLIL